MPAGASQMGGVASQPIRSKNKSKDPPKKKENSTSSPEGDKRKTKRSSPKQPRSRSQEPDRVNTLETHEEGGAPRVKIIMSTETVEQGAIKGKDPMIVKAFVETSLKKGVKGLAADFRGEKRGNDFTKMTAFVAQNAEGRNRYKDVGCLDNNRVELTIGSVPYIHANYVSGIDNPKKFICTQAPVQKTITDFWHMIVQERCRYILMLCNHKEQGANKYAEYYPSSVAKALTHEGITIIALKIYNHKFRFPTPTIVARTELEVTIPGQKTHRVDHLHWRDWPDRGVPPVDLAAVELCGWLRRYSRESKAPIVVHCSAGIGRTGSIVLIDLLLDMQRKNMKWDADMLQYLRNLRAQRNNSVQTEHQYLYVHLVILNYIINNQGVLGDSDELAKHFAKFQKQYKDYCKGF